MARKQFVSINLTPEAVKALRERTISLTSDAGRRVTMSDVLIASLAVATPIETIAELAKAEVNPS